MITFLGIDAGTTALKAALFDLDGRLLALDRQEYALFTPSPAVVELDAEAYWRACCRAVRAVVKRSGARIAEIASLCISSQGETLVPVDGAGTPTRNAIVWLDNRAVEEARLIGDQFDLAELYHTTGQPEVTPTWPAPKILWIKRHEPEVFARSARFLLLEDYLLQRMTGQFVTEYGLQTSSLLLDIRNKRWWQPMLDFVGVLPERLGCLMEPGAVVGPLSLEGAAALGLSTRTLAVTGAMDQAVGAVGAGNVVPGIVSETTGGALAIVVTLDRPLFDPARRVPCHYHARQSTYCLLPWVQTAGMALKWLRDQFFPLEAQAAREGGRDPYDVMTALAAQIPAGSEGLVVLPHREGATCPEFNPAAKAVFYGATLRHTRAHFVRGIMEAVAYTLKRNLDIVEQLGVGVKEIRSMGGGARSGLWLQIKADVLQKPVAAVAVEEAACLGAALLGATATGHFASLNEGVARMVRLREPVQPDPANADVYAQSYVRYLELYERLAPMFRAQEDG
jgi:xylulokinase